MDNHDTVLLLQGGKDIPPVKWRTRAIRRTPGSALAAVNIAGVHDARWKPVFAVVVRGFDGMQEEARHKEERRHRMALMHTRLCMHKLVCAEVLAPAALPVVLEVQRGEISAKGSLGKRMKERLQEVTGQGAGEGQPQRRKGAIKVSERIKVVGRRTWMGKAVLKKESAGLIVAPPADRYSSKSLCQVFDMTKEEKWQVQLKAFTQDEGALYALPPAANTGVMPWAVSASEHSEVGNVSDISWEIDFDAEPGAGSLLLTGNVDEIIKDSGRVAQAFVRLHRGWISTWLGKAPAPQRDPNTANLNVHLSSTSTTKSGLSIGAAVTVALIAWYWDMPLCNDRVVITGEISLSGHLGAVLGLREKALATCQKLAGTEIGRYGEKVQRFASLIIPIGNHAGGIVVEPLSAIDGNADRKIVVPGYVRERLTVLAVSDLFEIITLVFPRPTLAPPVARRPTPSDKLVAVQTFFTCKEGGACQVIECSLSEGGSGRRFYTGIGGAGVKDAIEAGLKWLRGSWDRDVVPNYDGPIYHRPADANYDLHFHLPTTPLQIFGSVSCAAIVAVLSLLFRKSVPAHIAVVAEVKMNGKLHSPLVTDATLLSLAKANGITCLVTTPVAANQLRAWKAKDQRQFGGLTVQDASSMDEVMERFFDE